MARVRIKEESLQSWDEVDQHLRRLGEIDNKICRLETDYNDKVTDLKAKVDEKVKPLVLEKNSWNVRSKIMLKLIDLILTVKQRS